MNSHSEKKVYLVTTYTTTRQINGRKTSVPIQKYFLAVYLKACLMNQLVYITMYFKTR